MKKYVLLMVAMFMVACGPKSNESVLEYFSKEAQKTLAELQVINPEVQSLSHTGYVGYNEDPKDMTFNFPAEDESKYQNILGLYYCVCTDGPCVVTEVLK